MRSTATGIVAPSGDAERILSPACQADPGAGLPDGEAGELNGRNPIKRMDRRVATKNACHSVARRRPETRTSGFIPLSGPSSSMFLLQLNAYRLTQPEFNAVWCPRRAHFTASVQRLLFCSQPCSARCS